MAKRHNMLFCLMIMLLTNCIFAQNIIVTGEFPQPSTVALYKPVIASSTCGTETENYCQYNTNAAASLSPNCISATCNNTCPFSNSSPVPKELSEVGSLGPGVSVVSETGPGQTDVLQFIDSFVTIASSSASQISENGFTFAAWIKQDEGNTGTLISKATSEGLDRTYTLSVTETTITFDYQPSNVESGYSTLVINNLDLMPSYWHHVTVTVYQDDFGLYINGSIVNATGLEAAIIESSNTVFLGQVAPGSNHYNGLIQDIYSYSQALTAREVEELVTGIFPFNHLSTDCRCPPSHPVINSISPTLCIQHTGIKTQRGSAIRLNSFSHTVGYINDNNFFSTWISAINQQQTNVSLTLVSGSVSAYELIFVFIRYGAPAPKAAVLEKSVDGGNTYQPLQYFADDCSNYFGLDNNADIVDSDDVNCITEYSSQSPTSGVTARVRFLDGSRGQLDGNTELQNFILSGHIRLRMLDYFTGNTTIQHRYYSISEITIAARCACNGHAPRCSSDLAAVCDCVHNTQGDRCQECLPLYNDKPWRVGTSNLGYPCKICDCNNHASRCHYNASIDQFPNSYDLGGGGSCDDCEDNTDGQQCETCIFGFYRPAGVESSDAEPCVSCNCNTEGSTGMDCVKHEGIAGKIAGQCDCKTNVQGLTCDQCNDGFFNLSSENNDGCEPCNCNSNGTVDGLVTCNSESGKCVCKLNVEGLKCDQCVNGTQGLSASNPDGCSICNCNSIGSINDDCDTQTGQCNCKPGVTGISCDQCIAGFYGFSESGCQTCECTNIGSESFICDVDTGICSCLDGFEGQSCDVCATGFFNFSAGCTPCKCSDDGTISGFVDDCDTIDGQCQCKDNVDGRECDSCKPNFTNLQGSNSNGCSPCDCVLNNTDTSDLLCNPVSSQCTCLPSAAGLRCDSCQDGFYSDSESCLSCDCVTNGAVNASCNSLNGQCFCVNSNIGGRTCDQCLSGHYDFPNCLPCQCDLSGSINSVCDNITGECQCKMFVEGMGCDTCIEGYQQLDGSNPFGCSKAPEEQSPPTATTVMARSILLTWSPPEMPNGVIALYSIHRDGIIIISVPGVFLSYNDTGLTPNSIYIYQIESVNIVGSTKSEQITVKTLEAPPEEVNPPQLTVINGTSINAQWVTPNVTNGEIVLYNLKLIAVNSEPLVTSVLKFSGLAFSISITDLSPFTVNTFVLEVCTSQGCSSSSEVSITTAETAPDSQSPPSLTVINSSAIFVNWQAPTQPNGIIVKYDVYQRVSPFIGVGSLVESVGGDVQSLLVEGLEPFTVYEYSVEGFTSVGGTLSEWVQEITDEAVPENVPDPEVTTISSQEIKVQWTEPAKPNGIILLYHIYLQYPEGNEEVFNSTETGSYTAPGLSPFTQYGFLVFVCNTAGCAASNVAMNTTFESAPSGLAPPSINITTDSSVQLYWDSPAQPNGIIIGYSVNRTRHSLQLSPAQRDFGTSFYGASYASFPPNSGLTGFNTVISLMFKTFQPSGVILYSMNEVQTDFMAIELRDGIPWFMYDAGSGPGAIRPVGDDVYNDGNWHQITVRRAGKDAEISIDGSSTGMGSSVGQDKFVGNPNVLYIGGLANDAPLTTVLGDLNPNATLDGHRYSGCLFAVKFGNPEVELNFTTILNSNPGVGYPNYGCPINQEVGVSFLGGGYLSMPYDAPETKSFSMSLWFRTTYPSGLLMFSYSSDSHIIVNLYESNLVVRIQGIDSIEIVLSSASLPLSGELCNGQWHQFEMFKESDGIIVNINDQSLSAAVENLNISTSSNLFLGGVPVASEVWFAYKSITSKYPLGFSGCARSFKMNNEIVELQEDFGDTLEHVRFDGCDVSPVDENMLCQQEVLKVSTGLERAFTDFSVIPFAEYLYQVSAENSAGNTQSLWALTMTGEAAPQEVGTVTITTSSSTGFSAIWERPSIPNGLIIQYQVIASPIYTTGLVAPNGNVVTATLNIETPAKSLIVSISGLEPATNYSIILSASTSGGSGNGETIYAFTLEGVPLGVQTPFIISETSTSLQLQWNPPTQPNGVITIYRLYIANSVILLTGETATVNNLSPFTTYEYHLEACTAIGCSNSTMAVAMTLEDIPTNLDPPALIPLSSTSIQAFWSPPANPNGIIIYYELVRVFGSEEEFVTNTTEQQVSVSQLLPNTLYYFKIVAYNSVGSVSSNVSSVMTPEDTPDQILPPSITVINSTALLVMWQEPLQPNGIIVNYTLLQDGSTIFTEQSLSYTVTGLQPFTQYFYAVVACTVQGCGTSSQILAQTAEAVPEVFVSPVITSTSPDSVDITVNPVGKPNGIVRYILRVTGEFLLSKTPNSRVTVVVIRVVYNESVTGIATVSNLVPYSDYIAEQEVTNTAGSLIGEPLIFTTASAAPELQIPPVLSLLTATSITITWTSPTYPNGILKFYTLTITHILMGSTQSYEYDVNSTSTVIGELLPFSEYGVVVTSTNDVGNVSSESAIITTGEIAPADFDQTTILSTSAYGFLITWDPPATPNGLILNYTIILQGESIDTVLAVITEFNVTGLMPFNDYNISIKACNTAGCVTSFTVSTTTDEAAPEQVPVPTFTTLPDIVIISWTVPLKPNGIIIQYAIYRAILGGTFSFLDSVSVTQDLQHNDTNVQPYTQYQYYIEASTTAGSTAGNPATVLTEQSAPEGVPFPILQSLSFASILITILPPSQPNGIITQFILIRHTTSLDEFPIYIQAPDPLLLNITYTDTNLQPYTNYSYTITACTIAGCNTGPTNSKLTLEAPPTDIEAPSTILQTDNIIFIGWQAPFEPNGVIQNYSLLRADIGYDINGSNSESNCCLQYLSSFENIGSGFIMNSIYCNFVTTVQADMTSYIETDLDPFFVYSYCVVATNGAGSINSEYSTPLQTSPALAPLAGPNVTTVTINSTAIYVTWDPPDISLLLGPLEYFTLYGKVTGDSGLGSVLFTGPDQEYTVGDLAPSTTYTFVVEVSNTRGTALGNSVDSKTLDGIPLGVQAPLIVPTGATSVLISWVEPSLPNGDIIIYSIFLNSVLFHNQSTPGSLPVTDLKPFTLYITQLEACTQLGCTKSGLSSNRTLEAAPIGLASPTVITLGPYEAQVSWTAPVQPNGIVTQYTLYVRQSIDCPIEENGPCYQSTLVFADLAFNYTITGLSPATEYGFEVVAINDGGNVSSGFTTETTDEAPPTLVFPPILSPLSSTSIDVLWTAPDQPNGIIIGYFIFRDGNQIGEMLNVLTFTDTSLSPFTSYSYLIQACTSAGCTNSTEITNTTLEAPPTGFDDPIISNVDSNSLMISWIPPSNPNGRDLEYTVYFANGTIVFNGSNTSTNVQGLLPFTNYTLGVTVCNNAGCTESDTVNTQTDEATPVGLAVPMVRDLSSFSVEISWQPPSMANGIILYYILRRDSKDVFEGLSLEFDDEELEGDTQYMYELEAFNSAGSVTSPTITIHTQPDLPSGVNPPVTTVLNSTAIFVQWSEPAKTNGDIMEYRLVVNNVIMFSGLSFNHTLMNLTAFTTYIIYVQVCNQAGCASSKSVSNTTNEDLPTGVSPPVVTALSGTSILVSWSAPTMPNGIITEYRVFRREANNPLFILIQFVGGADVLSFTNQGVNPFTTYEYQLVVYNSIGSTESEFVEVTTLEAPPTGLYPPTFPVVMATHVTVSWSEPTNPNGILVQYELFYRLLLGELMSAVTVPANTTQFNITGLEPNTIYEFKVRVTNGAGSGDSDFELVQTAESSPEDLGPLILVTKTSESLTLTWNSPGKPNGVITSYALFLNGEEEYRDTDSIYTIDRLKPFTGYSIQLEACTLAGCTRGTTQGFITEESTPIGQPAPTLSIIDARSVTITWGFPIQSNGIISSYDIFRMEVLEPLVMNNTDEATLIYTTTDVAIRIFNDTTLFPDTGYQYAVRANNSVGYSLSAFTYIQTPEAAPEFIPSPELEVLGISEIKVTWDPPGQTNGELTQYHAYKISPVNIITIEYTGLNREFTDSDLKPFSQYSYFVEACTNAGCTNGTSTAATTDESVPEDIIAPVLKALSESAISITWIPPSIPNGILISYIVNIVEPVSITVTTEPNKLSVNISSLQPYTDYTVHVQACTSAGCTVSDTSAIQTLESIPFFIDAPLVFALGPISVDTSWSDPAQPNGVIIRYILRRNDTIVYDGTDKSFIDENLLPNQAYAYDVQAFTSVGGGERSAFSIVTTHSDTPTDVAPPNLSALDSFSVLAQWTVPGVTNGVIQGYILYVNESVVYNSTGFGFVVTDLMIFTTYAFRVEACTTTCGSSLYSYVTTLEAPPEGQTPPTLSLTTNGSVLVTWAPPSTPNGIIKTYLVERRQVLEGGQFGPVMSIATNIPSSVLDYLDDDNANLAPAMTYSYRVTVSNSVGSDTSEYMSITLPEAAPESISAPALINKTSTSITVSVSPPTTPNGLITQYTLFGSNLFSIVKIPSSQTDPVTFIHTDLQPYTEYTLYVEACTSVGCTIGPTLTVLTNEDTPVGLLSPIVTVEGARSIRIEWTLPSQPNGIITRYTLFFKLPCPQPKVFPTDTTTCTESSYQFLTNTTSEMFIFEITENFQHPQPYTSYQFVLQAENKVGAVNSSESEVVTTITSAPEVISLFTFTVFESNQSISLNWANTFRINGPLSNFIVIRDGIFLLIGRQTFAVFPNQPTDTTLLFSLRASNGEFEVTTPNVPLQVPGDQVEPTVVTLPTSTTEPTAKPADKPFYEEPAFIVGMVVLAVLLCFVFFLFLLCLIRPNRHAKGKYDTLKSQTGRQDGTVRSSWAAERMTPVPSYSEALTLTSPAQPSGRFHSYSPEKATMHSQSRSYSPSKSEQVLLMNHDYSGEEIPLQETHISRFSKISLSPEDIPLQLQEQQNQNQQNTYQEDTTTRQKQRMEPIDEIQETTFMDTKI